MKKFLLLLFLTLPFIGRCQREILFFEVPNFITEKLIVLDSDSLLYQKIDANHEDENAVISYDLEGNPVKVDSTITINLETISGKENLEFINLATSLHNEHFDPGPFGGESIAILSFLAHQNKASNLRLLQDVKHRCREEVWQVHDFPECIHLPSNLPDDLVIEFIIKLKMVGYCVPLIQKN